MSNEVAFPGSRQIKDKSSKNQLARQVQRAAQVINRLEMERNLLWQAIRQNTCACGHWAIRHFGGACDTPECKCQKFEHPKVETPPAGAAPAPAAEPSKPELQETEG